MKKFALISLSVIVALFAVVITYHYWNQEKLIFRSQCLDREHKFSFAVDFEEIFLPVASGGEVHGLHFRAPNSKGIVLFFHGRGKNIDFWSKRSNFFLSHHLDVMLIDYRGFGKSSPGFKEEWFLEDAIIAYDYVKQHYSENQIIVYGHSLGTAMATWAAAHNNPNKLILEAPFYSMLAAVIHTKPFIPEWVLRMILKYPLRTHTWIEKVRSPIYIFHGKADTIVPFAQGQLLFHHAKKTNAQVEFIPLDAWGHTNFDQHDQYQRKIKEIFETTDLLQNEDLAS